MVYDIQLTIAQCIKFWPDIQSQENAVMCPVEDLA